jgi:hypothetical protein
MDACSNPPSEPQLPYLPTERQCALLILYLISARDEEFEKKGQERKVSRARISQNTIRRLCGRSHISNDFLLLVQEYLLAAGWALFCIGPTYYAVIKLESVQGWSRISSKRIADDLKQVPRGKFLWQKHEHLLGPHVAAEVDDRDSDGEEQSFD